MACIDIAEPMNEMYVCLYVCMYVAAVGSGSISLGSVDSCAHLHDYIYRVCK